MSKITYLWLSGVFFQALNTQKLCPGPGWGSLYDAPPDPLVGWGGGHTLPIPFPRRLRRLDLGAFGAPVVRPPDTNSWLRLWPTQFFSGLQLAYPLKKPGAATETDTHLTTTLSRSFTPFTRRREKSPHDLPRQQNVLLFKQYNNNIKIQ